MEIRDYGQDQELAKQFFRDFSCLDDDGQSYPKYSSVLTQIANREKVHLLVEMNDVEQFNQDLAFQISRNTKRYVKIFYQAIDQILPSYKTKEQDMKDPMDVFIEQRLFVAERNKRNNQPMAQGSQPLSEQGQKDIDDKYPPELIRRYELTFKPASLIPTPIRKVLAEHIGKLITVRGIVTRATDVKPKIVIATYNCDQCGCETFQPIHDMVDYTPLFECTSAACKATKALGKISMQTRGSKFVKFQEVKLQEHSDQVPTGHIPRTITIMVHGELSRCCAPGDHISVSGVFLPIEKSGFRMRTGGLTADTYIEAHYITQMNKGEEDELNDEPMTPEEAALFTSGDSSFLKKLSSSIAPEIFGHENLKKALLLLLVGGVDKTSHGMKIRGNINICLMGDPGVAKSQLLSFIDRLATRSQYTTGRGSSGVGLTAAVLRDPITNEMVLEGGALVLADKGICCIDEFDKMMDSDRTAIHEVMEQQTVSIAKAGIMTTLNARVSILAAANPAYGRYNTNKTVADNLQLPPALLSRFDLIWLIKDTPEESKDLDLAQHITSIHQNPGEKPPSDYDSIDMKVMRRYINLCKLKIPVVPHSLDDRFVKIYLDIRAKKRINYDEGLNSDTLFTSPRSLLAIIRLSTAFARLRLADVVDEADVNAAVDLYNSSRESIENDLAKAQSTGSKIFGIIRSLLEDRQTDDLQLDDLQEECEKAGFDREQFDKAVKELEQMDLIYTSGDTLRCIH